jgi:hypothetical protein
METIEFTYTEGDFSRVIMAGIACGATLVVGCAAAWWYLLRR